MGTWAERATNNMLHLSRAKTLGEAMREWSTTGGYEDSHSVDEVCELCEHEGLRYQYEIENSITGHTLWSARPVLLSSCHCMKMGER